MWEERGVWTCRGWGGAVSEQDWREVALVIDGSWEPGQRRATRP